MSINSFICTLFEDHYHYGVAALTNSLFRQGYRGEIYAGYRGGLPQWSAGARENPLLEWEGGRTLQVAQGLKLHFLPLDTTYHLTNYKPNFMLRLWDGPAANAQNCFYYDPDIVVNASWKFLEEWVDCGIALCEDINSPLAEHHPRRIAWRRYFGQKGIPLCFKQPMYANGGFVGVSRQNRDFLSIWLAIQEAMAPAIGGLGRSQFAAADPRYAELSGPFSPFGKTDQDALNAAVEAWKGEVSFVGQEAMAFKSGVSIMPHALGPWKPWLWKPVARALAGCPPRTVDRDYWKAANGPIMSQSNILFQTRQISISVAALIGRFYRRNS